MVCRIKIKSLLLFFGMFVKTSRSFKFFLPGIALLVLASCSLKRAALNQDISFKIPADSKQITRDQLDENTKSHQAADQFFVYNGVFLAMNINHDSVVKTLSLEKQLARMKYIRKDLFKIESAEIRTIKGNRFIVMDYYHPGKQLNVYTFFNDYERNRIVVDGTIQYNKATQKKDADKLLEVVLSSLKGK
ncbi:MAG: hypothetical protein H7Y07_12245 [Pyrinomonadaceae bacterium]|nr:hypothetical protein [Sphingobacteriaceae bacterium]